MKKEEFIMFCRNCGTENADNAAFCAQCGAKLAEETKNAEQATVVNAAPMTDDDEMTVKRIRDNAKLCSILWIVIGAFQVLSCLGAFAGGWNIVMGIRGLKFCESIVPGNRAVYEYYDKSMNTLIAGAIINFLLGLLVGCALSAFEFFIRDSVLKNKKAFGA